MDKVLGTAQLGLNYGINNKKGKPSKTLAFDMLDCAYSHNIRCLDTAQAYGDSESVIGEWMRKRKKTFRISSKIKIAERSLNYSELLSFLIIHIEKSLECLGVSVLDNLFLHSFQDFSEYGDDLICALKHVKRIGLIKSYGFSIYDEFELMKLENVEMDSIQIPVSIWNSKLVGNEVLKRMKDSGTRVFSRSAFVQGLIFKDLSGTKFEPLKKYQQILHQESTKLNIDIATLAYSYIENTALVDRCIIGVENMEQLKAFIAYKAVDVNIGRINRIFSEVPEVLIDPRKW